ncbi:MAG: hypothetical protein BPH100C_185 [Phage 5P_2]|nr:MAG: hypothetical protein BPH100C_185 [Phage 5P_2]
MGVGTLEEKTAAKRDALSASQGRPYRRTMRHRVLSFEEFARLADRVPTNSLRGSAGT